MEDSVISEKKRAFSVNQAAEMLGCHKISVYRRIWSGEIKVLSGFSRLTIPDVEIDKFLNKTVVYTPRRRTKKTDATPAEVGA